MCLVPRLLPQQFLLVLVVDESVLLFADLGRVESTLDRLASVRDHVLRTFEVQVLDGVLAEHRGATRFAIVRDQLDRLVCCSGQQVRGLERDLPRLCFSLLPMLLEQILDPSELLLRQVEAGLHPAIWTQTSASWLFPCSFLELSQSPTCWAVDAYGLVVPSSRSTTLERWSQVALGEAQLLRSILIANACWFGIHAVWVGPDLYRVSHLVCT